LSAGFNFMTDANVSEFIRSKHFAQPFAEVFYQNGTLVGLGVYIT